MAFSADEIERYGRQVLLSDWGAAGQERLRDATVEVEGVGAAAEAAILYLAAAGVGRLRTQAFGDAARALNPHVLVESAGATLERPVAPVRALRLLIDLRGTRTTTPTTAHTTIDAAEDRFAVGAAAAVEACRALLGLPHRASIELGAAP